MDLLNYHTVELAPANALTRIVCNCSFAAQIGWAYLPDSRVKRERM